jgi:hypothetical protein
MEMITANNLHNKLLQLLAYESSPASGVSATLLRRSLLDYFMEPGNVSEVVTRRVETFLRFGDLADANKQEFLERQQKPHRDLVRQMDVPEIQREYLDVQAERLIKEQMAQLAIDTGIFTSEREDLIEKGIYTLEGPTAADVLQGKGDESWQAKRLTNSMIQAFANISFLTGFLPAQELLRAHEPERRYGRRDRRRIQEKLATLAHAPTDPDRQKTVKFYADPRNRPSYIYDLLTHPHAPKDFVPLIGKPEDTLAGQVRMVVDSTIDRESNQVQAGFTRNRVIGEFTTRVEMFRAAQRLSPEAVTQLLLSGEGAGHTGAQIALREHYAHTLGLLDRLEAVLPTPAERPALHERPARIGGLVLGD